MVSALAAVVAVLAAGVGSPANAASSQSASSGGSAHLSLDALSNHQLDGNQCSVPVSGRRGGWVCPPEVAGATATEVAPMSVTPMAVNQRCVVVGVKGCWNVDASNRSFAYFYAAGMLYGCSTTVLGKVDFDFSWTLSGPAIKANPIRVKFTRATTHTNFEGSIFNGAVGVKGSIKNSCPAAYYGTTASYTYRQWLPSGCVAYDNESWDHESVIQVSWWDSAYRGRWWTYIKSPVAHSTDKQLYLFRSDVGLPGDPWSVGYAIAG